MKLSAEYLLIQSESALCVSRLTAETENLRSISESKPRKGYVIAGGSKLNGVDYS